MIRRTVFLLVSLVLTAAIGSLPGRALEPQIVDPALDHPAPMADLTAVSIGVATVRGKEVLQFSFEVSGDISPETRNAMTGYNLTGMVGKCELFAGFNAFPSVTELAGLPAGSGGVQCGETGQEIEGSFQIQGNKVTVQVPMRDIKGLALGDRMTDLRAHTAIGQGFNGDDERVLANTGDVATSDKEWTLSPI